MEQVKVNIKKHKKLFAVLVVLAVLAAPLFVYTQNPYKYKFALYEYNKARLFPNKVVDPSDPRFDLSKFRFDDYTDRGWFEVFQLICVPGTSRNKVRNILVDSAKAEEKSSTPPAYLGIPAQGNLVTYEGEKYIPLNPPVKRDLRSVNLYVQYDEEGKIVSCRGIALIWMRMGGYKNHYRFKVNPDCKSVKDCFY